MLVALHCVGTGDIEAQSVLLNDAIGVSSIVCLATLHLFLASVWHSGCDGISILLPVNNLFAVCFFMSGSIYTEAHTCAWHTAVPLT